MALTLTNTTLTPSPVDTTEIDANFANVVSKFAGGVVNADVNANAGIQVSKLSASYQEVWLELAFNAHDFTGGWPIAAVAPAAPLRDELLDFVPLPGSDADVAWVVTDVSYVCNDTGTVAGTFDVRYGAFDAGGDMIGAGTVVTGATITAKGADLGSQGRSLEGGSVSLTQSATVRCLYLVSAGAGTNVMDDAGGANTKPSWLRVKIAMRRQIQA